MKRLTIHLILLASTVLAAAQGLPFIRNFSANDYNGNNRNFDMTIGKDGTVFVANFDGLLYYNNVEWRIIHTPNITRTTVVYKDKRDTVWAGGYNYFGRIKQKANGDLTLRSLDSEFRGEVQEIWERGDTVKFLVNDGKIYRIENNKAVFSEQIDHSNFSFGMNDIFQIEQKDNHETITLKTHLTQNEPIGQGLTATVRSGEGLTIRNANGNELYSINEGNGLMTSNISYIGHDYRGKLWGATEEGIFCIDVPSPFSHFTKTDGIWGQIQSIVEYEGQIYVGTFNGVFLLEGLTFTRLPVMSHACWELAKTSRGLLAATSNGVYRIANSRNIQRLSSEFATSLYVSGEIFYCGQVDGVYLYSLVDNTKRKVCPRENIVKIIEDNEGTIWLQSLYGEVLQKRRGDADFKPFENKSDQKTLFTIVPLRKGVQVVDAESSVSFPYPLFSQLDSKGVTWMTNEEGKQLYRWKDGQRLRDLDRYLNFVKDYTINAMFIDGDKLWLGCNEELIIIDTAMEDSTLFSKPHLSFRSVMLGNDSILWGGFGDMPTELPELKSNQRNLQFTYSLDAVPLIGKTLYRYRLDDGEWSQWSEENMTKFHNLPYGSYTISIQALSASGELSNVVSLSFSISYPFYMKWYMIVFYLLLVLLMAYGFYQHRLARLKREKQQLEEVIEERTAEVVKQKDEILEKSKSLEKALHDLGQAQKALIRQEKMATIGKLTQGLIDRILNPLNYINNFSKLSEGLVKDIEANIEDEKNAMDKENYEDTVEVLGMLKCNLQKVGEHGLSTTRTLKAMEEILKDRTGGVVKTDLTAILKQNEEVLTNYYADDIRAYHISTPFEIPQEPLYVKVNPELLSKVLMSLLSNSVYAVIKKVQRAPCEPEISVKASVEGELVAIRYRDTGTGIEKKIISKIFDPFFTTKTTGEASGIGLYLSHDIIQSYGGDITVESVKDVFTEFTVTLPLIQE